MKRLKTHGPRGTMLLGFSIISLTFGYAYISEDVSPGSLRWLAEVIPLSVFGWLWLAIGVWLAAGAFSVRQSKALGAYAAICFMWGSAYLVAVVNSLTHGNGPGAYYMVPIFYGLTIACGAAVRMVNPAQSHVAAVLKPGPPDGKREDSGG